MRCPFPGMDPYVERPAIWPDFHNSLVVYVREPYIAILEPPENRIVTVIEVLSPDNKSAGPGRDSYLQKREEFWRAGTHLVEIDLLRSGLPTVRVDAGQLADAERTSPRIPSSWRYIVAVTRLLPTRRELYPVAMEQRLPRIRIPLAHKDPDVVLDLQAAFQRTWEAGPFPELLHYDDPPPGQLTEEEIAFCRRTLGAAGN